MENATDALLMAASVLLLIIALTVSISSFTSMKNQVDVILQQEEETDLAIDEEGNYINYVEGAESVRTVAADTVISTIRRMIKEEYTVIISGECIANGENVNSNLSEFKSEGIIKRLTTTQEYDGETLIGSGTYIFELSTKSKYATYITNTYMQILYDEIKGSTFKEYLGIWQDGSDLVSDANKETYRIITFVEVKDTTTTESE